MPTTSDSVPTTSDSKPERQRWLKWLHRVGYIATALIVAELVAIGFFATRAWLEQREFGAAQIEESRTHEGPLQANDDGIVRGSAVYLLGRLPALNALHGDGFRFVSMPSFNQTHFAVAIFVPSQNADEARGVLARFDQQNRYVPFGERQFHIPAAAYRSLVAKLDKLNDGWRGDSTLMLDGTPTAFERVRGQRVTSGIGNSHHYDQVGELVWNYLRKFAPGDDLPSRGDWERSDK